MNKDQINRIRTELEELKSTVDERRSRLARHVQHREEPLPQDFSEQAVAMENDETMVALDGELAAQQQEIEQAFRRMDAGTYGTCTRCGNDIAGTAYAPCPPPPCAAIAPSEPIGTQPQFAKRPPLADNDRITSC